MSFKRSLKFFIIFLIIFTWIFTSVPLIWKTGNWQIPPKIQEAKAVTAGPNSPSSGSTETGGGTVNWSNPGNITSSDDSRATAALGKRGISYYLKGTGFSFSIPDNAHIDGITVEIEKSIAEATNQYTYDYSVKLIKGGVISGNDYADTTTLWPANSQDAYVSYGGSSDLWGLTWTPADINSSNFGVAIQSQNTNTKKPVTETSQVDHIRITITYTLPTVTVDTTGSQTASMNIPSSDNYVGGAFTMSTDINNATVTQMIITETGTVNANTNLSNVRLYYETAATCSYDGNETAFNSTGVNFNSSEKATASGTMTVGTSQVCVYVVLDVGSGASANETIEIEISNPSTEVTVSDGSVTPSTAVAISGTTTLQSTPSISCTASTSTTDFGTLTPDAVYTSTPNVTLTISTTYSTGFTLYVHDAGAGTGQPGLYSTTTGDLIDSLTTTLSAGTEGYGIQAATTTAGSGATLTINSIYLKTGNDVGGLETSDVALASSTASCTNREIVVTHKAAISNLTKAASDYLDIITYSCSGN